MPLDKPKLVRQRAFESCPQHKCFFCGSMFICSIVNNDECKCMKVESKDKKDVEYFCDYICKNLHLESLQSTT